MDHLTNAHSALWRTVSMQAGPSMLAIQETQERPNHPTSLCIRPHSRILVIIASAVWFVISSHSRLHFTLTSNLSPLHDQVRHIHMPSQQTLKGVLMLQGASTTGLDWGRSGDFFFDEEEGISARESTIFIFSSGDFVGCC